MSGCNLLISRKYYPHQLQLPWSHGKYYELEDVRFMGKCKTMRSIYINTPLFSGVVYDILREAVLTRAAALPDLIPPYFLFRPYTWVSLPADIWNSNTGSSSSTLLSQIYYKQLHWPVLLWWNLWAPSSSFYVLKNITRTTDFRSIQSAEQKQVRPYTALPRPRRQTDWNPMNISITFWKSF